MKLAARRADRVIVKEVQATYDALPIEPDDIVLDLGANIGAASRLFIDKGASIVAVEPDPTNMRLLRRNLGRNTALWAAVGPKLGRTTFYFRPDKPYLGALLDDKGRVPVVVPTVTLGGLLAQYRPTIVKCDIEFGEYALPELRALPDHVRALAIELHVRYDLVFAHRRQTDEELRAQREEAASLLASFKGQGFETLKRKDKVAKDRPIEDYTGLGPFVKSIDAIFVR